MAHAAWYMAQRGVPLMFMTSLWIVDQQSHHGIDPNSDQGPSLAARANGLSLSLSRSLSFSVSSPLSLLLSLSLSLPFSVFLSFSLSLFLSLSPFLSISLSLYLSLSLPLSLAETLFGNPRRRARNTRRTFHRQRSGPPPSLIL